MFIGWFGMCANRRGKGVEGCGNSWDPGGDGLGTETRGHNSL